VLQDVDGNGLISLSSGGEVQGISTATLVGATKAWDIVSVSASVRTVQLLPKKTGTLKGLVRTFLGAQAISGATVQVWPGPFETVSDQDGAYSLEVYAGQVWKMLVKKEGYIPFAFSYSSANKEQSTQRIIVRPDSQTTYNVEEMVEFPEQLSGTAKLGPYGSFMGVFGLSLSNTVAGDFQHSLYQSRDKEGNITPFAQVCACQEGQRGIVGIGDRGSTPLEQITIIPIGYVTQSWIQLVPDSVYISKAREGLEGHFVVFRVDSIAEDGVTISYLFR
jgi:hypothetical protein